MASSGDRQNSHQSGYITQLCFTEVRLIVLFGPEELTAKAGLSGKVATNVGGYEGGVTGHDRLRNEKDKKA